MLVNMVYLVIHLVLQYMVIENILQIEKELLDVTGLKIVINFNEKKQSGNLNIKCKSLTEFNYIISKIKS